MTDAVTDAAGDAELGLLAAALTGDAAALAGAAALAETVVARHRLGPALASRAAAASLAGPAVESWRQAARAAATTWVLIEAVLHDAGAALGDAGVRWVAIKGCDLARRVYAREEERPTSDVDLLVARRDLDIARRALAAAGWRGSADRRSERYLRQEGYAWQASRPGEPVLELHYRLWGSLPAASGDVVVEAAERDPGLPASGHRPAAADAWMLAAVHWLSQPVPRPLLGLWDLERLAATLPGELTVPALAATARRHDVALHAVLAARAADRAFPRPLHRELAARLAGELRATERALVDRATRRGGDAATLPRLTVARLLAGRRSRLGWRPVWRRLWAHPGVVVAETRPAPWPVRRLRHLAAALRRGRLSGR